MKNRSILSGVKAREELTKGANFLAECVKSTLGVYGQNWYLDKKDTITNDGVTVAREIQLCPDTIMPDGTPANEFNARGAKAMREASVKTVEEVGDGTTTAVILAQAIYHECSRFLGSDGIIGKKTPIEILNQIEKERKEVTEKLVTMTTPISTEAELINSAIVSMGDKELGTLIGKTQWKLGKDGYLLAEETAEKTSSVENVRGICIDNGIGTGTLINNQEKQQLEVSNAKIVLTSYTIKTGEQWNKWIAPIAEKVHKMRGDQLVIIARAWTEETLQMCMINLQKGAVKVYPVNSPYVNMGEKMKDLQALTGATYFDSETTRLEDLNESDIGYCEKLIARRMDSIVTGKETEEGKKRIEKRIKELEEQIKGSKSDFEKAELGKRIAQLKGGFAIVKVGSYSDMERHRLFDKTDDAVHAVRAAFQEGVVKGGGLAFKEISEGLPNDYLLKRPLLTIYQQIMSSAPKDFVIEDWVKDPVKVLRIALQNACAAASSFATAGGVVTESWDKPLDLLLRKNVNQTQNEQE